MAGQPGFFDADERLRALSAAGDPLERLQAVVDFEAFRPELETALARADRSRGGRPPYDAVLMFRILVLQTLYTLSDDQTEYQLRDHRSKRIRPAPSAGGLLLRRHPGIGIQPGAGTGAEAGLGGGNRAGVGSAEVQCTISPADR